MSESVTKSVAQVKHAQKIETGAAVERIVRLYHGSDSRGSARRPRRHGRLRAGQVLAEVPERDRVLRFQGIRGLGSRLVRPDHGSAQGNCRQSGHDHGVQGRRSGQRPAFSGWLHDRRLPVESKE